MRASRRGYTRQWIVCYDIANDSVRTSVSKALEEAGWRLQDSVFLVHATLDQARHLRKRVARLIEARGDSIRWYPACGRWKAQGADLPEALQHEAVGVSDCKSPSGPADFWIT